MVQKDTVSLIGVNAEKGSLDTLVTLEVYVTQSILLHEEDAKAMAGKDPERVGRRWITLADLGITHPVKISFEGKIESSERVPL